MARTSNVFARVEPEIKEQAEAVLDQLGIPMSNAIGIFLRQIVMHNGIPFEMKIPEKTPLDFSSLSEKEFNEEIEKGLSDIRNGKMKSAQSIEETMKREYGI